MDNNTSMPRNLIKDNGELSANTRTKSSKPAGASAKAAAEGTAPCSKAQDEALEQKWRAQNLPACKLKLRWRYAHKKIPLYERHLRSLGALHVGPALQAWVRSRLEWVVANKLHKQGDGVVVLSIDTEGNLEISLEPLQAPPHFGVEALSFEGKRLRGHKNPSLLLWVARGKDLILLPQNRVPQSAAETFTDNLAQAFGYTRTGSEGTDAGTDADTLTKSTLNDCEIFIASDEFGILVCDGHAGKLTQNLSACFDKLWSCE